MEFRDVVAKRRMVRRYHTDQSVPQEVLDTVLRHATRAPSAGFSQGWDFVVLPNPEQCAPFWDEINDPDAEPNPWLTDIRTAPTLILCCADKETYLDRYAEPDKGGVDRDESRWAVPVWIIDTGMAALMMLLTAVDEGIGGLFFSIEPKNHPGVHARFSIPSDRTIIGVVALGYPAPAPKPKGIKSRRRPLADVIHYGKFGTPEPV